MYLSSHRVHCYNHGDPTLSPFAPFWKPNERKIGDDDHTFLSSIGFYITIGVAVTAIGVVVAVIVVCVRKRNRSRLRIAHEMEGREVVGGCDQEAVGMSTLSERTPSASSETTFAASTTADEISVNAGLADEV